MNRALWLGLAVVYGATAWGLCAESVLRGEEGPPGLFLLLGGVYGWLSMLAAVVGLLRPLRAVREWAWQAERLT